MVWVRFYRFYDLRFKFPVGAVYIMAMFVMTRTLMSIAAVLSHFLKGDGICSLSSFLNIWTVWESFWYLGIASDGYSAAAGSYDVAGYAFFPLYPGLIRLLAGFTGSPVVAGLIISNVSILIASLYLYKLVRLESGKGVALRSIKYMFLFPGAFILSAVLAESLFLAIAISCFYYAKKGNWYFVGVLGFLASLSQPTGVIVFLPVVYEYLKVRGFNADLIRFDVIYLLMIPAGILLYALLNLNLAGDPLAFVHAQAGWGAMLSPPPVELMGRYVTGSVSILFGAVFTAACIAFLLLCYRDINFSMWLYSMLFILIPLSTPSLKWSMARYLLVLFPMFIIMAKRCNNKIVDIPVTLALFALQWLLMTVWMIWPSFIV